MTPFTNGNTYTLAEPATVTGFQLKLGDGSMVSVPCTEIVNHGINSVLAAAIHHLIQRVAALEAMNEEKDK
tara:strand:- start:225 stop:437 length:213 start_codon:yes stop_codon:yes gene_type:complete